MSSNEGSSSGTHLLRNRGASLDIEVMIGELGVELNRIENIVEVEESQAYPTPTLKCRPLSLFDNYQVIGGVPAFVFENQGDHQKQICTYSVSSDGSRLAVAMKDNSICVYNLLDSCSLVAKGESSSLNLDQDRHFEVYYISFWNARNDKLIVLSKDANIAFVSIKRELDTSNKCEDSESTYASVFVVTHPFIVDQTQLHCTILDVFVDGFTLWVASKDISHDDGFITINRITEERYMQVKIYDEAFKDITNCHVQLGGNIAMVTQCSYGTSLRGETTHFISVSDYRGNHTMTSPPINGRLIEWDLETNYILIVQMQNDQHMLYLYSLGAVKHKVSPPIASFELGKRLIDVKGVFLSRKAWPHCELEATSNAYSPLVCVVSIKSSASILSIWDTHLKKIIKQIDVSIDKMQITHRSTISFSMSQDRKWFALGCSSTKKVTLFSLSAEVMVLYTTMDIEQRLLVLPLGPYSMRDSLPYIDAFDDLPTNHRVDKLNKLACQFEASCFNMPFNGMTNLHRAIKYGDIDVINLVLNGAEKHNIQLGVTWYQDHIIEDKSNILETAISEKREDLVRAVLNLYEMQKMPFNIAAAIIKRCFEDIWQTNRLIFEAMLLDNLLLWDICSIDVPVKMLSKDEHLVHVGMLDDPLTWKQETSEEVKNCIWESLEVKCNRDDHHNAGDTKIKTEMKIFCMEDICKIGSRGIIRFLLTQRAPSYLFKTPLIKWTIFWKWEHLWKKDTVKSSIYFLCMLAIYTTYVICFGFYSKKLQDDLFIQVSLTLVLLLSLAMNTRLYFQEVKEIKTRIKDGQRFFPGRRFAGLMYYLSSSWNIWENVTYFVLLFGIVPLHFVTFYSTSHIFFLNSILAIEIICLWRKLWYYAQAFTMTSAFVLMIENVVRDCIPFLILSGIALVGFSLALFILFQHSLHYSVASGQENDSGDHVEGGISLHKINASYGTPQKSMLTLFYAMIGTFDVEIYSNSGTLAPFIIFIFVSYLSVQAIALFNTLLAIISDTFDKVKSTEEEQLLIGRARFIDAREASMSEGQIKKMDEKIGRYLYVVLPKDKELHTNQDLWKGRVRTIGRRVQKIVSNSQAIIMENTKNSMKDLEKSMQIDKGEIEEYVNSKISALKEAMNRDIKALKESMKRNLYFLSNVKNDAGELEESMKNDRIALEHVMKSEIKALEEVMRSFMENIKEDISILKNKIEQK
eukprot:g8511.t1